MTDHLVRADDVGHVRRLEGGAADPERLGTLVLALDGLHFSPHDGSDDLIVPIPTLQQRRIRIRGWRSWWTVAVPLDARRTDVHVFRGRRHAAGQWSTVLQVAQEHLRAHPTPPPSST